MMRAIVRLATLTAILAVATAVLPATRVAAQGNLTRRDTTMINRSDYPLLANFRFRSIGPASMGGRIDDIAVYDQDPRIIWVGYATGGVFRSTNAGTTFEPVFEQYGTASIGDIAIDQTNPDVVYVGTGEPNNRNTSSFGDGIYKTTDGGETFTHIGLRETQTIARIVIDPRNSQVVYVASPGHLYGPDDAGGAYKSTGGGQTWTKVLQGGEYVGVTDLAIDPENPDILYAASYQRQRTGCCFNGGGGSSGLWKTEDGGSNWTRLFGSGLPPGTYGRIALAVARSNPKVVYAQIETDGGGVDQPETTRRIDWCNNAGSAAAADSTEAPPEPSPSRSGIWRSEDKGRTWTVVSNCNGRPMYFSNIRVDPTDDQVLYVSNVRAAKSLDGGRTFARIDQGLGLGNQTVDQHAYWIDPANPDHVIRGSDAGLAVTWDQGATWEYVRTMATGLAYWVSADMHRPYNVCFGLQDNDTWAGPSATRARAGIRDHAWFRINGGDGMQTAADPTDRFTVYGESQNGNVARVDLRNGQSQRIRPSPPPPPPDAPAPEVGSCVDGRIITSAGGRRGRGGGGTSNVINAEPGDTYRFNWNTPFALSPHDPNVIWVGGNRMFRSSNRGDLWTASADLTKQVDRCEIEVMGVPGSISQLSKNDGVSSFSTIVSLSESPVARGVVWAGTDDGNLQVSRDNGLTFTEVGQNITGLPAGALSGDNPYWISRIDASHFDAGAAYVSIDGHRADDLRPYIFLTRDYGRTWTSASGELPAFGNVRVVREDPKNPNLLYAGTEFGLYISLDGGKAWKKFMNGYPTVRTDDILVHPRDGDLIVASHGRSIWIADDITPLQQWTPQMEAAEAVLFDVRPAVAYKNDMRLNIATGGEQQFEGENPTPGTAIHFYVNRFVSGDASISVMEPGGRTLCESTVTTTPGELHRVQWTLAATPPSEGAGEADSEPRAGSCTGGGGGRGGGGSSRAAPGTYVVKLTVGDNEYTKPVQVLEDIWMRH